MWRHTSRETMKHCQRDSSQQGSSFSGLPNAKKWRFTKLEASIDPRKRLSTSKAQELHPASWQAQKHIPCVHGSLGILSSVRSLVLSGLVSCITLRLPNVTSFSWSNLIGAPPMWRLEQKRNRPLTRLFFPSMCRKSLEMRLAFPPSSFWLLTVCTL